MIEVVLLGTGSPLVDPLRAGPATLVRTAEASLLVDAGRGVLMRAAAVSVAAGNLDAVLLTHLHSDHITDLNDLISTRWVTSFTPTPLVVHGPPGTREVVDGLMAALAPDIRYRTGHHADLPYPPPVQVHEALEGDVGSFGDLRVTAAPTDHRPVEPTVAYRFDQAGTSVVVAGDTVPCDTLDALCAGADALVITAIRTDVLRAVAIPRIQDILDYHSSVEQAAQTAQRAGVATLVLTHYVPAMAPGTEDDWRALAAAHFSGTIELGDDLHAVRVGH